ncbi:MAG: amidase family protein, partial [Candidatus Angelobacter sp.]
DIYTVTADLAGGPGISVPCGQTQSGLPIGLQVLGKHFDEGTILRVGNAVFSEIPSLSEGSLP